MHRPSLLILSVAAGLAFAAGAEARPKVSTDVAPGANLGVYKSYSWYKSQIPVGMNAVMYQRILSNFENALAQRGYQKTETGDLSLILTIGAREKTEVQNMGFYGFRQEVYQYTEGQLSLDVFDTKSRQAVWHGQVTDTIRPNRSDPAKVDSAIAKLMAKWPTPATASAKP